MATSTADNATEQDHASVAVESDSDNDAADAPDLDLVNLRLVLPRRPTHDRRQQADEFIRKTAEREGSRPSPQCHTVKLEDWERLAIPTESSLLAEYSVGDEATAVFVNDYGELLSIRKFVDLGPTGNFVLERNYTEEMREDTFNRILDGEQVPIGIRLRYAYQPSQSYSQRPTDVHWIHDRWPRMTYMFGSLEVSVQIFVHKGVVVQQHFLKNPTAEKIDVHFDFCASMLLGPQVSNYDIYQPALKSRLISTTSCGLNGLILAADRRGIAKATFSVFEEGRTLTMLEEGDWDIFVTPLSAGEIFPESDDEFHTDPPPLPSGQVFYHEIPVTIPPGTCKEITAQYLIEAVSLSTEQKNKLWSEDVRPHAQASQEGLAPGTTDATGAHEKPQTSESQDGSGSTTVETNEEQAQGQQNESTTGALSEEISAEANPEAGAQGVPLGELDPGPEAIPSFEFLSIPYVNIADRIDFKELNIILREIVEESQFQDVLPYLDVSALLIDDRKGHWLMDETKPNKLFRRQLEHILSVCTIKLPNGSIALVDGGIIYSHAYLEKSFTTIFRYLLNMYELLGRDNIADDSLRSYLQSRIRDVCTRHLDWVFDIAQQRSDGEWATLYECNGTHGPEYRLPTDFAAVFYGASNWLKLFEYYRTFPFQRDFVLEKIGRRGLAWIKTTYSLRNFKSEVWPHSGWNMQDLSDEDPQVKLYNYWLNEQVSIWMAIKSMLEFLLEVPGADKRPIEEFSPDLQPLIEYITNSYKNSDFPESMSPAVLRERILNRFTIDHTFNDPEARNESTTTAPEERASTTKDPRQRREPVGEAKVTTRRLIASKRSAPGPKYIFRTYPALYEASKWGFFDEAAGGDQIQAWKNSIREQSVQRGGVYLWDEASWEKAMIYAHALLIAQDGHVLDGSKSLQWMNENARRVLYSSTLPNGTFPALLDEIEKTASLRRPTVFGGSPLYHIPNILLQIEHKVGLCREHQPLKTGNPDGAAGPSIPVVKLQNWKLAGKDIAGYFKSGDALKLSRQEMKRKNLRIARAKNKVGKLQRLDMRHVNDPPAMEPEWLWRDSDFFRDSELGLDISEALASLKEKLDQQPYSVLRKGVERFEAKLRFSRSSIAYTRVVNPKGRDPLKDFENANDFDRYLRLPRTREDARKRMVVMEMLDNQVAFSLYETSPISDKLAMLRFLSHHQQRSSSMTDTATDRNNLWITEVHVSFWHSFDPRSSSLVERQRQQWRSASFVDGRLSTLPTNAEKERQRYEQRDNVRLSVTKATMGFRFVGNVHDDCWTFHAALYVPGKETVLKHEATRTREAGPLGDWPWDHHQRKVVELVWFSGMMRQVHASTSDILQHLDTLIGQSEDNAGAHYDAFQESFDHSHSRSAQYREVAGWLRNLDEANKKVLETADLWEGREKQRGIAPRWSLKDEEKYRADINKWTMESRQLLTSIRLQAAKITSRIEYVNQLRDSLTSELDLRESRLAARSAEDVRLFTYATVIFLPLSFVSSLFSMQGPPSHNTAIVCLQAAIIALAVTFLILFNVKTFNRNWAVIVQPTFTRSRRRMRASNSSFWKSKGEALEESERWNLQHEDNQEEGTQSKWWYAWFWLRVAVILPAVRVAYAWDALRMMAKGEMRIGALLWIWRVLFGLVCLPFVGLGWIFKFVIENIAYGLFLVWNGLLVRTWVWLTEESNPYVSIPATTTGTVADGETHSVKSVDTNASAKTNAPGTVVPGAGNDGSKSANQIKTSTGLPRTSTGVSRQLVQSTDQAMEAQNRAIREKLEEMERERLELLKKLTHPPNLLKGDRWAGSSWRNLFTFGANKNNAAPATAAPLSPAVSMPVRGPDMPPDAAAAATEQTGPPRTQTDITDFANGSRPPLEPMTEKARKSGSLNEGRKGAVFSASEQRASQEGAIRPSPGDEAQRNQNLWARRVRPLLARGRHGEGAPPAAADRFV